MELRHKLPLLTAVIVVALILGTRFVSSVLSDDIGSVDPHVMLPPNQAQQIRERQRRQQVQAFVSTSEGEVARTEERIREVTALGLAVSLFSATESLAHRIPVNVNSLLSGVQRVGLLPPGMELVDNSGLVSSARGALQVRYRSEPLCIEVVSVGRERTDGPVLLLRVPSMIAGKDETGDVVLYMATRLDEITIPQPFASDAQIITLGFAPEPLRAATLPDPDATND
jgi:hypothetical protein